MYYCWAWNNEHHDTIHRVVSSSVTLIATCTYCTISIHDYSSVGPHMLGKKSRHCSAPEGSWRQSGTFISYCGCYMYYQYPWYSLSIYFQTLSALISLETNWICWFFLQCLNKGTCTMLAISTLLCLKHIHVLLLGKKQWPSWHDSQSGKFISYFAATCTCTYCIVINHDYSSVGPHVSGKKERHHSNTHGN